MTPTLLHACERCRAARMLLMPTRLGLVCAACWYELGQPGAATVTDTLAIHEAELRTRERMTARGGTDRHLVRNGRT